MSGSEWMGASTQTNDSSIDYYDSLESYFNRGCYIQQDSILDEFYSDDKSERYASMMYLHNYMRSQQDNSNSSNPSKASTFSFSQLEKHSDALSQLQKRKQSSIGQMYLQQLEKQKQLKTNIMKKVEAKLSGIAASSSESLSAQKESSQPSGNFCDLDRLNQTGYSPGKTSSKSQVAVNSATQLQQSQQQSQQISQQPSRNGSSSFLRRKETQLFEPMVSQEQLQQQYFYTQQRLPSSQIQLHSMPSTSNFLSQQSPSVSPSRNRPIKPTQTQEDDNINAFSASKQRKVVVISPAKPATAVLQLRNQYKQLREASREVSRRSSMGNTVSSMSSLKGGAYSDYYPEHTNLALPFSATTEQQNVTITLFPNMLSQPSNNGFDFVKKYSLFFLPTKPQKQSQLSHPGRMMNNFIVSSSQFPYQHAQMLMQTQQQLSSSSSSQVSIQSPNPQPLILNKNVKTFSKIFQSYSKINDDAPQSPLPQKKDQLMEHVPSSLTLRHYQRKYIPSHASAASLTMPSEELDPEKYEQKEVFQKNENGNNTNNADGNSIFNNINANMQAAFSTKG